MDRDFRYSGDIDPVLADALWGEHATLDAELSTERARAAILDGLTPEEIATITELLTEYDEGMRTLSDPLGDLKYGEEAMDACNERVEELQISFVIPYYESVSDAFMRLAQRALLHPDTLDFDPRKRQTEG